MPDGELVTVPVPLPAEVVPKKFVVMFRCPMSKPRCPTISVSPNAILARAGSIACEISSRQTAAERVRPVTIASASPVATMHAANTLRS